MVGPKIKYLAETCPVNQIRVPGEVPGDVPGNVPGGVPGNLGDVPGKLPSDLVGKLPLIPPFNLRGGPQAIYGAASWGRCWGRSEGGLGTLFLRSGATYRATQFTGRGNLPGGATYWAG